MSATPIERLSSYVRGLRTRQGVLARAALGAPGVADDALARELAEAMAAGVRPDGTVAGGALATIWRAHELLDLGRRPDDPAVARILGWLLDRQGRSGAYGEGCDKIRHAQRICQHCLGGFFSPAPKEQRLAPITLPNGKVFRAEPAARFAISCLGVRAALRAGLRETPGIGRHLESLGALATRWSDWTGFFAPDVIVAGLHALALGGPAYRPEVSDVVEAVAAHQKLDGLWLSADLFATLEALTATGLPAAHAAVRRAAPALASGQRPDGTFGLVAQQERALIGLRALRWAETAL